jgi:hypothetical protein
MSSKVSILVLTMLLPRFNNAHILSIKRPRSVLVLTMLLSRFPWFLLAFLLAILVACSSSPDFDSVYKRITPAQLKAGDSIPMPRGDVILTVAGAVGKTNHNNTILMDLATIESVGLVEYAVVDPFENRKKLFRGVLMRELLNLWQVDAAATTLDMVALNDYHVDVPIALMREKPLLFALQADGEYMRPDYRGPAMLVFPYGYYKFQRPLSDAYWIWQIKAIAVK